MIEKNIKNNKNKTLKTEPFHQTDYFPIQFGKPIVRLPIINKKSGALRFMHDTSIDKSLDSKQKVLVQKNIDRKQQSCLNVQQFILRKYSNNSQLQLLTHEELELCAQKSKKILPKIVGAPSRQNTDRSPNDQFHKRLNRMKSEKKIDSSYSQLGCYKIGPVLGRGNYSIVKLCETKEGKKFAAKMYPKQKINSTQREENLRNQIKILSLVHHQNIVYFKEHIQTEENHYIIMQAFDNISLLDYIKKQKLIEEKEQGSSMLMSEPSTTRFKQKPRLSEQNAKIVMKKIIEAFIYLHENGIAHRDVKLENVLISNQKDQIYVKIIDFGFSRIVSPKQEEQINIETKENNRQLQRKNSKSDNQEVLYDFCGTPSYMSPEITEKKGYLGRPSDIWGLGVLLFYIVTGHFPFRHVTEKSDFNNSIFSELSQNIKLSSELVMLVRKMLKNNPGSRPTAKEIVKQSWFQ